MKKNRFQKKGLPDGEYEAMAVSGGDDFTVIRLQNGSLVTHVTVEKGLEDLPEFSRVRLEKGCNMRFL